MLRVLVIAAFPLLAAEAASASEAAALSKLVAAYRTCIVHSAADAILRGAPDAGAANPDACKDELRDVRAELKSGGAPAEAVSRHLDAITAAADRDAITLLLAARGLAAFAQ
jgi:hypothetical protein